MPSFVKIKIIIMYVVSVIPVSKARENNINNLIYTDDKVATNPTFECVAQRVGWQILEKKIFAFLHELGHFTNIFTI